MIDFIDKVSLAPKTPKPHWKLKKGTVLAEYMHQTGSVAGPKGQTHTMVEISSAVFATQWYIRQRFEVDEGRIEEPILYTPIYSVIDDPTLPETVEIFSLGPGGVIFEQIVEGSEVHFATVTESERNAKILQWGVGVEYTKKLIMFNQLWNLGIVERAAGRAHNALLNHLHLYPIIGFDYSTVPGNQTAAHTGETTLMENMLRTFEDAILDGEEDVTNDGNNRRVGPYVLLASVADRFTIERALTGVDQQGVQRQSSAINAIGTVVFYNGWIGRRGLETVRYPGVTQGKAYLISTTNRNEDFVSLIKQDLERTDGNPDVTRFILEQSVWDVWRGVYANPARSVQEITLPTS